MKTGFAISIVGHAAVVVWSVLTFTGKPTTVAQAESLTVDIISTKEFSQITKGTKDAPKEEQRKPLVEKVAEAKPVDEAKPKLTEKPEIKAATDVPPTPEPKPPEPKKAEAASQPDQIAEAIKKDDAKPEPKTADAKTPIPQRRPKPKPKPQPPKFNPNQIAALLDRRDTQRNAATGRELNAGVAFGLSSGTAAQLSQSELDALRRRLAQFWNPPVGARDPRELIVQIRMQLNRDGTLAAPPQVLTSGNGRLFMAARDSAVRAIFRGQPFTMLNPANYETWKDVEITFDPRDMIRG
jgi:colicin import membrane protein